MCGYPSRGAANLPGPRRVFVELTRAMSIAPPRPEASEEEAMILDVVRQLVKERVEPRAAAIDADAEFAWDIRDLFAENDLLGIPVPAEYGGLGGSFVTYVEVEI